MTALRLLVPTAAAVLAAASVVSAQAAERTRAAKAPVVLAASSLTEALPRIYPQARYFFAGSNQLAQQIRLGAPFDVFLSASPEYTRSLRAEGLVREPVAFASNSLVVIVPRANPARISTLADLGRRPGLRLVVAGPKVPIGAYTREVLRRAGLATILRRTVSSEPDVKGIVGKVALGEADAGFVYETDAGPVRKRVRVVRIPERHQPAVRLELAIAAKPRDLAAARAFVRAVLAPRGGSVLRAAGFERP